MLSILYGDFLACKKNRMWCILHSSNTNCETMMIFSFVFHVIDTLPSWHTRILIYQYCNSVIIAFIPESKLQAVRILRSSTVASHKTPVLIDLLLHFHSSLHFFFPESTDFPLPDPIKLWCKYGFSAYSMMKTSSNTIFDDVRLCEWWLLWHSFPHFFFVLLFQQLANSYDF